MSKVKTIAKSFKEKESIENDYVTADHHFVHKNMLRHEPVRKERFETIDNHDNQLIKIHNSTVTNNDIVYFVGDFVPFRKEREQIERYISKLNGKEKHLILGNHDNAKPFTYVDAGFTSVHTSLTIRKWWTRHQTWTDFVLHHDPCIQCLLEPNQILLCGHVHTLFHVLPEKKTINVGVDVNDFKPILIDDCLTMLGM